MQLAALERLKNRCHHVISVDIDSIFFKLAGNKDMHNIMNELEFRPDRTTDYGVSSPWASKKYPYRPHNGENGVSTFSLLFLIGSFWYFHVTRTSIKAWMSLNILKWDLTLAHWTQVSDRCPLGYLFFLQKEQYLWGLHSNRLLGFRVGHPDVPHIRVHSHGTAGVHIHDTAGVHIHDTAGVYIHDQFSTHPYGTASILLHRYIIIAALLGYTLVQHGYLSKILHVYLSLKLHTHQRHCMGTELPIHNTPLYSGYQQY